MQSLVEGEIHSRKRVKYASHACLECKRRKIRCSGDEPCRGCRTSRNRICAYLPNHIPSVAWNGLIPRYTQVSLGQDSTASHFSHDQLPGQQFPPTNVPVEEESEKDEHQSNSPLINSELLLQPYLRPQLPLFPNPEDTNNPQYVSSKLFPNKQLGTTLRVCFEQLELYYPCIDSVDFYNRLSDLFLLHSICQGKSTRIPIDPEHLYLAALTCLLLAVGTYLGGDEPLKSHRSPDDSFREASLVWYAESATLLSKFECAEYPNLDLLRYHMLEIIYMTMLGRRGGMTKSLALAVDLAYSLGINDERTWSIIYTTRQREYRRILWWTLVYMDCRIALSFQRPLLLRQSAFRVGDFTDVSFAQYMQDEEICSQQDTRGRETLRLPWSLPAKPPEDYWEWLLFSMRWSKVVARVWVATPSSFKTSQNLVASIEMADIALAEIHKTLPPSLRWNVGLLPTSIKAGDTDTDRACRFRIIVYEATNVLRMSVRCSWLCNASNTAAVTHTRDYESTAQTTELLTSSVMNVVVTYITLRNYARPWSTYASSLLVQLSSRVAPLLRSRNALSDTSSSLIASISNAQACMQELATIKLFAARNASARLTGVLQGLQGSWSGGMRVPRLLNASAVGDVSELNDEMGGRTNMLCSQEDGHRSDDAGEVIWENLFSLA